MFLAGDVASCADHLRVHVGGVLRGQAASAAGLEHQALVGDTHRSRGRASGVPPSRTNGNQNASREEVDAVDRIVCALLRAGATWIDSNGRDARR